jgi:DNA-directed RNA polymerase specialized sigma subunit
MADTSIFLQVQKERAAFDLLKHEYETAKEDMSYIHGLRYDRPHVTGGQHGDVSSTLEQIERLQASYEERLNSSLSRYVRDREAALEILDRLTDPIEKAVIERRYLSNDSWKEIAAALGYAVPSIYKIHRRAMNHLQEL